jgi:hypothetical protein
LSKVYWPDYLPTPHWGGKLNPTSPKSASVNFCRQYGHKKYSYILVRNREVDLYKCQKVALSDYKFWAYRCF